MQSSEQRAVRAGTSVTDEQRAGASQARGYRNVVLGFLVLAYTLNFIDRSIVGIIGQAIKVDLLLTDAQLGLLGGLAFALLYTSVGLPIARVAERSNRVNLISIAIVIWSGFTALCGLAQSFVQLLLFRAGVGIGEAGLVAGCALADLGLLRAATARVRPCGIRTRDSDRRDDRHGRGRLDRAEPRLALGVHARGPSGNSRRALAADVRQRAAPER